MDPDAFWTKTPREAAIIIESRWNGEVRKINNLMAAAWHTAMWTRAKKLPKLERVLIKPGRRKERQTWQEQMAIMDQWSSHMRRITKASK